MRSFTRPSYIWQSGVNQQGEGAGGEEGESVCWWCSDSIPRNSGCAPGWVPTGHCSRGGDGLGPPKLQRGSRWFWGLLSPLFSHLAVHWRVKFIAGTGFVLPVAPCCRSDFASKVDNHAHNYQRCPQLPCIAFKCRACSCCTGLRTGVYALFAPVFEVLTSASSVFWK